MWNFRRKKTVEKEANLRELKNAMDNAMGIQGSAMANQTEMNIAYQAYTLFRYKDLLTEEESVERAGELTVKLRNAILAASERLSV